MANLFEDAEGKLITPGCTVLVATYGGRLRKGVVYRTSFMRSYYRAGARPSVGVLVENPFSKESRKVSFRRPKSMVVVAQP